MSKTIPLTNSSRFVVVSDEDFDSLSRFEWRLTGDHGVDYAARTLKLPSGRWTLSMMHREIMAAPDGMLVDHRNRDGLDNQRSNLRLCTNSQNQANRITSRASGTGFKGVGVDLSRLKPRYRARITINGNRLPLGYYRTPEDAARAYDEAARRLFGEFARCNFEENA